MRNFCSGLIAALLLGTGPASSTAFAADHLDSPSVEADGRIDINDVYAFQSPANADNTVMILTVNPLAGVLSETTFSSRATYEFQIDNDGDAVADVTYTVFFTRARSSGQHMIVLKDRRRVVAVGRTGRELNLRSGGQVTADLFDDPFFFDLAGFQNGLAFTGTDFFAGANVTAIVLEVPSSVLGGPAVAVWGRTTEQGNQFDRMGRPAINTVLIPSERKDEFNRSEPADDPSNFGDDVRATIAALNGGDTDTAAALTDILLPDVLTVDVSDPAGFLNGRGLADDVIDAELGLLTNDAVTGDGVDANDVPFRDTFPYLAASHAP